MAYSEELAQRLRKLFKRKRGIVEKKMFGGVGFLLRGNMSVGVYKESLILRVDPEVYDDLLKRAHVGPFDITGRPMSGWVMVGAGGWGDAAALAAWVEMSLGYVQALPAKEKKC